MDTIFLSKGRQRLTPFTSQIVIEIFVVIITFRMVSYPVAAKSGNGFDCFSPGKVIIQIAMDGGVPFQFHKTLFQITD